MDDKGSILNVDGPSALKIELHVPRRNIEKNQERSADHHSSTYPVHVVGVEGRIMDDKSSFTNGDCPSELKVVCGPPGHRENSGNF
jgi:hypothetical protein